MVNCYDIALEWLSSIMLKAVASLPSNPTYHIQIIFNFIRCNFNQRLKYLNSIISDHIHFIEISHFIFTCLSSICKWHIVINFFILFEFMTVEYQNMSWKYIHNIISSNISPERSMINKWLYVPRFVISFIQIFFLCKSTFIVIPLDNLDN